MASKKSGRSPAYSFLTQTEEDQAPATKANRYAQAANALTEEETQEHMNPEAPMPTAPEGQRKTAATPKPEAKTAAADSFSIAPPEKKETLTQKRLTYLSKTLNDRVMAKAKKQGLSYNYIVNSLLEKWVNADE